MKTSTHRVNGSAPGAPVPRDAQEIQGVLAERAAALARIPEQEQSEDTLDLIVFTLGQERYAIDLEHMQAIEPLRILTSLPGAPDFWAGILNLRGRLYPVLDLARFLGGGRTDSGQDREGGMLLLVAGQDMHVCLFVDRVLGVQSVARDELSPHVGSGSSPGQEAVDALTPDLSGVINVEKLLADPRLPLEQRLR